MSLYKDTELMDKTVHESLGQAGIPELESYTHRKGQKEKNCKREKQTKRKERSLHLVSNQINPPTLTKAKNYLSTEHTSV